jgi:hypothetical protein
MTRASLRAPLRVAALAPRNLSRLQPSMRFFSVESELGNVLKQEIDAEQKENEHVALPELDGFTCEHQEASVRRPSTNAPQPSLIIPPRPSF